MTVQRSLPPWLTDAELIDRALYAAVAETPTKRLDVLMRRLSQAADHSKLSLASSALLALAGGQTGRRAARSGLVAVAVTSAVVNLAVKPLGRRHRPDRAARGVPLARQVSMPTSPSFPSGHTAAAVAFATGVGRVLPVVSLPLHALSAVVGYARVHTGVHYPGDVLVGAVLGSVIADVTGSAMGRISKPS